MSHYRKQVRQSFDDFPEPGESEELAIVQDPRGSNQVLVELVDGSCNLVVIPSKFHKVVFLKKGDLVIVRMEAVQRLELSKVVGSLVTVLHHKQTQHLADKGLIPVQWAERFKRFEKKKMAVEDMMPPSDSDEEGDNNNGGLNQRRESERSSSE
jgi:initiation factor 1A